MLDGWTATWFLDTNLLQLDTEDNSLKTRQQSTWKADQHQTASTQSSQYWPSSTPQHTPNPGAADLSMTEEPHLKSMRAPNVREPWKSHIKYPRSTPRDQLLFFLGLYPAWKMNPLNDIKLEMGFKIPDVKNGRVTQILEHQAKPHIPNSATSFLVKLSAETRSFQLGFSCHHSPMTQPQKPLPPWQWMSTPRSFKPHGSIITTALISAQNGEFTQLGRKHTCGHPSSTHKQRICADSGAMPHGEIRKWTAEHVWR